MDKKFIEITVRPSKVTLKWKAKGKARLRLTGAPNGEEVYPVHLDLRELMEFIRELNRAKDELLLNELDNKKNEEYE